MVLKILSCLWGERFIRQRWLGTLLTALAFSVSLCMRFCTSVAINHMVKAKVINESDNSKGSGCPIIKRKTSRQMQVGENDWSDLVQDWILQSFFIGYIVMHIPAGYLSDIYGSRWVLTAGILVSIICTALIPISADKLGCIAVIVLRIAQGIGQGGIVAGNASWLSRWIPFHERGLACAISNSGKSFGPFLGILVTDIFLKTTNNWRHIYYFWAALSSLLFFAMLLYLYSDPATHLHITKKEMDHLSKYIVEQQQQKAWPYRSILSDFAVIAIIIGQAGHDLVLFVMYNNIPKYMTEVLKYHIEDKAIVTSVPYIGMMICTIMSGKLADWVIATRGWDVGFVRKLFTTIANIVSSGLLVAIAYVGCRNDVAVCLFTLALCFKGLHIAGLRVNAIEVSTQYAGTIMGFANGAGCFTGFIGPYIVSAIAYDNKITQWQLVFWLLFVINGVSTFLYVIWGSAQRRRWDYPEEDWKFFQGKVRRCQLFDGEDKDRLAVERGRADKEKSVL